MTIALSGPWDMDHIDLTSVGIDIGSSTSHLTFSQLHLQRLGDRLSSRYVPVERRILYESPIILTPYASGYSIDASALAAFVEGAYRAAGLTRGDVDSGAVILTGGAAKRHNARSIAEQLKRSAGAFVCATAGPRLEAIIAAHGSGSVALSKADPELRVLNVDIGGGTTKFALIEDGLVTRTAAIAIGGRLLATRAGRIDRLEAAGRSFARIAGAPDTLGARLSAAARSRIGKVLADVLLEILTGRRLTGEFQALWVTPPLALAEPPDRIVLSGGVSEYALAREERDFGDLGPGMGERLRSAFTSSDFEDRVVGSAQPIRATVIGASQYTLQVSGNTISVSDPSIVPLADVRIVSPDVRFPLETLEPTHLARTIRADLERHGLIKDHIATYALAFRWRGEPLYPALRALADAVAIAVAGQGGRMNPIILLFDGDVGRSIGHILQKEIGWPGQVLCLDGIRVDDFDFVDIGSRMDPSGAYPVVVKSLVYPDAAPAGHER